MTIQRFARGYIARSNYRFGAKKWSKLAEQKRYRIEKLKASEARFYGSGPYNSQAYDRGSSREYGNSAHRNRPNVSASQEYTDLKNGPKKEADDFLKIQLNKSRSMTIIRLAKKNQWASLKMLDFVVLKTYLKETDKFGNTALYYAAINQNIEMCKLLLEKGANPNVQCEMKNTPFHCAYINGHSPVLNFNPSW